MPGVLIGGGDLPFSKGDAQLLAGGALAMAESFELKPKDVVYVAASPLANWNRHLSLLFPGALTRIVGLMIHIDLSGIDRAISWTSFGIGLVAWVTLCAASAVAFAAVYNRAVPS